MDYYTGNDELLREDMQYAREVCSIAKSITHTRRNWFEYEK